MFIDQALFHIKSNKTQIIGILLNGENNVSVHQTEDLLKRKN